MGSVERQILFGEVETSYDSDPTVAAANAIRARNVKYSPGGERWVYPTASKLRRPNEAGVVQLFNPTLSFESGLHGLAGHVIDATHKPPQMVLMEACGWSSVWHGGTHWDITWDPYHAASVWFERWYCGRLAKMGGCRGNFDLELEPRKPVKISWSFQGCDHDEASAAPVGDPDWTSWGPEMVCKNIGFDPFVDYPLVSPKLGRIVKMVVQSRTQLYRQADINDSAGLAGVLVVGRGASAEDMGIQVILDVEQPDTGSAPGGNDETRWLDRWRDSEVGVQTSASISNPAAGGIGQQILSLDFGLLVLAKEPEDIVLGSGVCGHRITCSVLSKVPASGLEDDLAMIWSQL